MKEQKYYKLLLDGSKPWWEDVEGEMVEGLDGILAFATNERKPEEPSDFWRVVDLRTGRNMSALRGTKGEAINNAALRLLDMGIDKYLKKQRESLDRFGESPAMEPTDIQAFQEPTKQGEIRTCLRE